MTIKGYAGIVNGRIHLTREDCTDAMIFAIYKRKKTAKSNYEYVIPCEIIINKDDLDN